MKCKEISLEYLYGNIGEGLCSKNAVETEVSKKQDDNGSMEKSIM